METDVILSEQGFNNRKLYTIVINADLDISP
jgi:hypothetical protein